MRILETSIQFVYEQILFFKFWKFMCDVWTDGKYFIENIAEGTRLFLEGEFDQSKTNPRNVGVTSDDRNFSQVG